MLNTDSVKVICLGLFIGAALGLASIADQNAQRAGDELTTAYAEPDIQDLSLPYVASTSAFEDNQDGSLRYDTFNRSSSFPTGQAINTSPSYRSELRSSVPTPPVPGAYGSLPSNGGAYDTYRDNGTRYTSPFSSGSYQYDLSNPMDELRYGVDPGAQLRDSINPSVDMDRSMGYYGGGYEK